jgi:hypothetical protein
MRLGYNSLDSGFRRSDGFGNGFSYSVSSVVLVCVSNRFVMPDLIRHPETLDSGFRRNDVA